jgi:hypothetical protein
MKIQRESGGVSINGRQTYWNVFGGDRDTHTHVSIHKSAKFERRILLGINIQWTPGFKVVSVKTRTEASVIIVLRFKIFQDYFPSIMLFLAVPTP